MAAYRSETITVGTNATLLCQGPRPETIVWVSNPSTTVTVYVGGAGVTTSTGGLVGPGDRVAFVLDDGGRLFGIVASSTQAVRVEGTGLIGGVFDNVPLYILTELGTKLLQEDGEELLRE